MACSSRSKQAVFTAKEVASFCVIEGNEESDIDSSHGGLTSGEESGIDAELFDENSSELGPFTSFSYFSPSSS